MNKLEFDVQSYAVCYRDWKVRKKFHRFYSQVDTTVWLFPSRWLFSCALYIPYLLKLKFQYFGHLIQRTDSFGKTLMLGKTEGRRRRGWQRVRWLDAPPTQWTWVWVNSGSQWWTGRPGVLQPMGSQRVRHDWATERLNWTTSPWLACTLLMKLAFLLSHRP